MDHPTRVEDPIPDEFLPYGVKYRAHGEEFLLCASPNLAQAYSRAELVDAMLRRAKHIAETDDTFFDFAAEGFERHPGFDNGWVRIYQLDEAGTRLGLRA